MYHSNQCVISSIVNTILAYRYTSACLLLANIIIAAVLVNYFDKPNGPELHNLIIPLLHSF